MIIKNKIVFVYDIEVFPNVFHCSIKNTENKERLHFEISNRKNEIKELIDFFSNCDNKLICGYNSIHYDNPIINFLLDYKNLILSKDYFYITKGIHKLSNTIIKGDLEKWKKWKYANNFEVLDLLTMLFSQALRVGLKEMQVTMQFRNVQEYKGDFDSFLNDEDIDEMIMYNDNDVDSTEELLYKCKSKIDLRLGIEKEFNIDVLSKDGMTIGNEILKLKYLEATGKHWCDIKDLRSPCDMIKLNEVILPFIKFDTPILQELLIEMKKQTVSPGRKGYEKHFLLDDVEISVGVGGIHSKNEPEIIIPNDDEVLLDSDVNSLYPSLLIAYEFIPKHLGKEWLDIYSSIREDRLYAKKHKMQIKNETYKLALNGATGNFQNAYSWMYDPFAVMQIRINGQLLLLMLTEKIISAGGKMKQLNTDGILYLFPKGKQELLNVILKDWETTTKLTLETEEFEAFYQFAINDYLAIGKRYSETKDNKLLKKKGMFIDEVSLGKGMNPMIIPKAINNYFANGVSVEQTILNCKDINDFITYQKVDKKFNVEYNGELIQRINRYYVSTNGYYLYKCVLDSEGKRVNYTHLLKGHGVRIINNFDDICELPKDIDYKYYIAEAKKIIGKFLIVQLKLF